MIRPLQLFIFLTFLISGASFGWAESERVSCTSKLTDTLLTETFENIDIGAQMLFDRVAKLDPETKADYDAKADKLLKSSSSQVPLRVQFGQSTKRTTFWVSYSILASVGLVYNDMIRDAGTALMITDHYSNSVWGLGLIGLADNASCLVYEACKGVSKKIIGAKNSARFRQVVDSVQKQLAGEKFSTDHRSVSLYATALIFTAFNAGFELNGLIDGFQFLGDRGNVDWADFLGGELAVVTYIAINKKLNAVKIAKPRRTTENFGASISTMLMTPPQAQN